MCKDVSMARRIGKKADLDIPIHWIIIFVVLLIIIIIISMTAFSKGNNQLSNLFSGVRAGGG